MNTKLVESLADAIAALSVEDYALFQEALIARMVRKTPGVAGGHACIRDTRITVWTVISLLNQGATEDELATDFPALTRFDFLAARAYYCNHRDEIDALIASHNSEDDWGRHKLSEFKGIVEYPFVGEDAQVWVNQSRQVSDEQRDRLPGEIDEL